MKEKTHVYQFALRRADDKKQQFIIENDLVYSEDKLSKEDIMLIAEKHRCDIQLTYLGRIVPPKNEEIISIEYHTKEMIQASLDKWEMEQKNAN